MPNTYAPTKESHDLWKADRENSVTSALGNLALTQTHWFSEDGPQSKDEASMGLKPTVQVTQIQRKNILTGEDEFGVRYWDSGSEAIQNFKAIATFAFNPEWILKGTFTPAPAGRTIPFEYLRDNGFSRDLVVPGDIDIEIGGELYKLHAFDDAGKLLLTFADATGQSVNPDEKTYLPGRFLFVIQGEGNEVTLDFNRAFVPPCGFSYAYNCPLPPPQNRIAVAVKAGEIKIVNK